MGKKEFLEIYIPGKPKKITIKKFDLEVTRISSTYSVPRTAIADAMGISYVHLWRCLCGKSFLKKKSLVKLKAKFPDFNLDKWLIYFGYQPDRIQDMSRKDPDMVYDIFYRVFYPDRVEKDLADAETQEEKEKQALMDAFLESEEDSEPIASQPL